MFFAVRFRVCIYRAKTLNIRHPQQIFVNYWKLTMWQMPLLVTQRSSIQPLIKFWKLGTLGNYVLEQLFWMTHASNDDPVGEHATSGSIAFFHWAP